MFKFGKSPWLATMGVLLVTLMFFSPLPAALAATGPSAGSVTVRAYDGFSPEAREVDVSSLGVGDSFVVWVEALNAVALQGVDMFLDYSDETLAVEGVQLGDIRDVAADPGTIGTGTISVGVANYQPADYVKAVLLKIKFRVMAGGQSYVRLRPGALQLVGAGGVLIQPGSVENLQFAVPGGDVPGGDVQVITMSPQGMLQVRFSQAVRIDSRTGGAFHLTDASSNPVPIKVYFLGEVSGGNKAGYESFLLQPLSPLTAGTRYRLVVDAGLVSVSGSTLEEPFSIWIDVVPGT